MVEFVIDGVLLGIDILPENIRGHVIKVLGLSVLGDQKRLLLVVEVLFERVGEAIELVGFLVEFVLVGVLVEALGEVDVVLVAGGFAFLGWA